MKTIKILGFPLLIILYLIMSVPFQSCKPDEDNECDSCAMVYKPNIYIYPTEQLELSLRLNFPMGGKVVTSIPEYGTGWHVTVDTNGLINNTYSFLFYESTQPNVWQRSSGWTVEAEELEVFFRQNMTDYGFNDHEIDDFIEYWIPRFNEYPLYSIYPQTKNVIDDVIELDFSNHPESILRLFYVIKGHDQLHFELTLPIIDSFSREGYFVTEWGVVLD